MKANTTIWYMDPPRMVEKDGKKVPDVSPVFSKRVKVVNVGNEIPADVVKNTSGGEERLLQNGGGAKEVAGEKAFKAKQDAKELEEREKETSLGSKGNSQPK